MIIEYFKKPYSYTSKKTGKVVTTQNKMVRLVCDKCSNEHTRDAKHYAKMKVKFPEFNMDYCNTCWIPILNNRPQRLENMRQGLINAYNNKPELREKMSNIVKGRNTGDNNPMKRPEVRAKVSATRSALMKIPGYTDKFKHASLAAWARGVYDNVNTSGHSNWYEYLHSSNTVYKVQGRYELAFIKYLDANNLDFDCHKGKIPYVADDGLTHHYFPDFYVYQWKSYVDPKASHWYKVQKRKFELLFEQHPNLKLLILTEDKLRNLGIKV